MNSHAYPTSIEVGDTVTLSGITYTVNQAITPEDHIEAGRKGIAAIMRQHGCEFDLICKRGKRGTKVHMLRAIRNSAGFLSVSYCMAF